MFNYSNTFYAELKSIDGIARRGADRVRSKVSRDKLLEKANQLDQEDFRSWLDGRLGWSHLSPKGYQNIYDYYSSCDEKFSFIHKLSGLSGVGPPTAEKITSAYSEEDLTELAHECDFSDFKEKIIKIQTGLPSWAYENLYNYFRKMPLSEEERVLMNEVRKAVKYEEEILKTTKQLLSSDEIKIELK